MLAHEDTNQNNKKPEIYVIPITEVAITSQPQIQTLNHTIPSFHLWHRGWAERDNSSSKNSSEDYCVSCCDFSLHCCIGLCCFFADS